MADMTFVLKFIAENAAAMKAIKDMQAAAKGGEAGKQAADVAKTEKAMKGAAEAAKQQTKAAKEAQAATKDLAQNAAKAEAATKKQAEASKAVVAETQAAARASEESGRQETARAEARMREIARRRKAYRDFDNETRRAQATSRDPHWQDYWKTRHEAEATAKAMKQAEAASRGAAAAQRELATATAKTAQDAAKAESRVGRIGQALRNVSWARVAGNAAADLAKGVAKGVADAVTAGLKNAASQAPAIFRGQALMGGGPGVRGAVQGAVSASWSQSEGKLAAVNTMQGRLGLDNAKKAVESADAFAVGGGTIFGTADARAAAVALHEQNIVADVQILQRLGDAAVGQKASLEEVARQYAAAKEGNIAGLAGLFNIIPKSVEGGQSLTYYRGGEKVERTVPEGDAAASMAAANELLSIHAGRMQQAASTVSGLMTSGANMAQFFGGSVADVVAEKFIRPRLEAIQAELAGTGTATAESMARAFGEDLVRRLGETENYLKGIATHTRDMVGPVDSVVQSFGGWKVAIGGLVALNIVGWLAGAAAGIKGLAAASTVLALSPAGKVLGAAAATFAIGEQLAALGASTGNQAAAQAEIRAIKTWVASMIGTDKERNGLANEERQVQDRSRQGVAGQEAQTQSAATGEHAAQTLALVEAVAPAARTMVTEVSGTLAQANFHSHGVAMMATLAAGIRAGSAQAVSAVRETTQAMRDHLPHSPAKTGPLSDLDRIRFSETLAAAIRPEPAIAAVMAVAAGMSAAIPAGMAVGLGASAMAGVPATATTPIATSRGAGAGNGGFNLTYSPSITLPAGANQADFARLLEEHKNQISEIVAGATARRADLKFE